MQRSMAALLSSHMGFCVLQETAAVLRKLWSQPGSGEAARLQLICGNTLERRLGPEALAALLKDVCPSVYKMARPLKRGLLLHLQSILSLFGDPPGQAQA